MNQWTDTAARDWYAQKLWPVGFNYVPSTAVNSTEMWQEASFDEPTIIRELGWARDAGFNSIRVFLQYIVWEHEKQGFLDTFERFLAIADSYDMTVVPILFDDCAFDFYKGPVIGAQLPPVPGVHNSRWTPSPGFDRADDTAMQPMLKAYVDSVVFAHRDDSRILTWDLYNEPGNSKRGNASLPLLVNVFRWARESNPRQPLTAGVWLHNDDSVYKAAIELSDIISFHGYTPLDKTIEIIDRLKTSGRPILNTEWLHRQTGNLMPDHLPLFKKEKIGCYQWGLVRGKTQTNLHWSTMLGGVPDPNPEIWQHDLLFEDGTPYDINEIELIRKMTGQ